VNFWINQFSLKNGEVLLGATRSWRRKFLRKFSEKKMSFCKNLGVLGLRGKMYTVGLVLGFWTKNGVSFLEIIRSRFLPAIGCL
jgi:hypothetical protein